MTLPMSENDLLIAITDAAKLYGWLVYHTHDSRHSAAGFPDLVLVRDGRLMFWELKAEKGIITEAQRQWLDALDTLGSFSAQTVVIRPSDMDYALEALK